MTSKIIEQIIKDKLNKLNCDSIIQEKENKKVLKNTTYILSL